jgi:hypothetical protein
MRIFIATMALVLVRGGGVAPSCAASTSRTLAVSATVVASCSIAYEALLSRARAAAQIPGMVCSPGASPFVIPAPQPMVTLTRDVVRGFSVLTIAF